MPQRKEIKWAQLRVGVMVTVSLIILAVGIFLISGSIGFLTSRYTLKAYFATAGGLRQGAQVHLAGIPVGNVTKIEMSPYADPSRAVEVVMRLTRRFQEQIRADSVAETTTAGLLGEAYIDISRGSPGQPALPDGGVVNSRQQKDIKEIVQNANDVISNLRVLSTKLNDISEQITSGQGSIGKLLYDESFYNRLNSTTASASRIVSDVEQGHGTIGKLVVDETLYQRFSETVDHLDQTVTQIQHGNGSMARFINDPAVYDQVKQLVTRANGLMDNINQGQGTLGKLVKDPELYNRANDTMGHVDSITARMDKGEGSLGLLSTSSKLYDSLSESASSLKEFLAEFRKNPKKYLTVHVKIF